MLTLHGGDNTTVYSSGRLGCQRLKYIHFSHNGSCPRDTAIAAYADLEPRQLTICLPQHSTGYQDVTARFLLLIIFSSTR